MYSYEEDDMVEDPCLIQHLSHFGINIMNLEKVRASNILNFKIMFVLLNQMYIYAKSLNPYYKNIIG